jgi:cell wall-associated NlpC family hydrolase
MPTAAALIAYADTWLGSPYGEGSASLQRGPTSHDCIGMWREWVLKVAPELWPTSWGGPDSWTVPNYVAAWMAHGLPTAGAGAPIAAGDALIFGANEHIGLADGAGKCISALNPAQGVCSVPIAKITLPLTLILQTRLERTMPPPGSPVGVARIGDDPNIRAIAPGDLPVVVRPGTDVPVYGTQTIAGHGLPGEKTSPAYTIADPLTGAPIALLVRNVTAYVALGGPAGPDPLVAILQAKIDAAEAALQ